MQKRHEKLQQDQANLERKVAQETAENIRKAQSRRDAYYLKLCQELEVGLALMEPPQKRTKVNFAMFLECRQLIERIARSNRFAGCIG